MLSVLECDRDGPRVALPHPEVQLVARFGVPSQPGPDVHAMGVGQTAHRKVLRRGQRSVTARLRLGATEGVLGVRASEMAGRIVSLEDLWGPVAARRLCDRLAHAEDTVAAAAILEGAIVERHAAGRAGSGHSALALRAAERLAVASVNEVAAELGVSERHLRRVFLHTIGVGPKQFAKLVRFHRALGNARDHAASGWAGIAAASGYYDQAHLIAEFRAIAGATPRALWGELTTSGALGRF